jgi:DNA-directed RNA polymerase subunit K/omega
VSDDRAIAFVAMPPPATAVATAHAAGHATAGHHAKPLEDCGDLLRAYDPSKNTTRNTLTRFETAKILGLRMEQLAHGAPSFLPPAEHAAVVEASASQHRTVEVIAQRELELRVLPFMVQRTLPNGEREIWRLKDMV